MAEDKTENQKIAEKILIKKEPAKKSFKDTEVNEFSEEYKDFIGSNKTEREIISEIRDRAEDAGFKDIKEADELEEGSKYYRLDRQKNLALIRYNGLETIHAIASHADSPCLHLKPYPLSESKNLAMFKSHYYGGIKKYQWMNIPLSLRGVAYTQDGDRVDLNLGEEEGDPCFTIPDLLPHLDREQMKKDAKKIVEGEQLNPIIGSDQVDDDNIDQKAKLAAAKILNEEYGLVEEDLISAELRFVPAGKPKDVGFDRSMVSGYGHDDRSSVFTSMQAMLDSEEAEHTQICAFYDKEEIGSTGTTGAKNQFFNSLIEELIEISGTEKRPTQVWENTKILSADVTAAIDPNFPDAHDESNANYLGYGVAVEKFGGAKGKYSSQDASAEFTHSVIKLLNEKDIPWQTGEIGKIDLGGGGTIAKFLAEQGAEAIDVGIPVLGMHSPFELASKSDLYSAYQAYKTFLENELKL